MKKLLVSFLFLLLLLTFPKEILAIYEPASFPNNKFGIHIADTADLPDAASLVNSSGGDWGYVTFVITEDNRDIFRWQTFCHLRIFPQSSPSQLSRLNL